MDVTVVVTWAWVTWWTNAKTLWLKFILTTKTCFKDVTALDPEMSDAPRASRDVWCAKSSENKMVLAKPLKDSEHFILSDRKWQILGVCWELQDYNFTLLHHFIHRWIFDVKYVYEFSLVNRSNGARWLTLPTRPAISTARCLALADRSLAGMRTQYKTKPATTLLCVARSWSVIISGNFRPAVKRTLTRKNHVFACSLFSCAYSSLKLQISTRSHYWCPQASRSSCLSEEFSNSGMFVIRCSCCFLSGNNSRNITLTAISRKSRDLYGSSAARVWANRAEYVHRHAEASWPR